MALTHKLSAQLESTTCSYLPRSVLRRLRNRDTTVIYWELLRAMASGPQKPSRLARVVNVPYNRLGEYLEPLAAGGLVKGEAVEGHEVYSMTPRGMEALTHLDRGLKMLFLLPG